MRHISRFVLAAVLAGVVVTTFTNTASAGWIVAGAVGDLLYLRSRRQPGPRS